MDNCHQKDVVLNQRGLLSLFFFSCSQFHDSNEYIYINMHEKGKTPKKIKLKTGFVISSLFDTEIPMNQYQFVDNDILILTVFRYSLYDVEF